MVSNEPTNAPLKPAISGSRLSPEVKSTQANCVDAALRGIMVEPAKLLIDTSRSLSGKLRSISPLISRSISSDVGTARRTMLPIACGLSSTKSRTQSPAPDETRSYNSLFAGARIYFRKLAAQRGFDQSLPVCREIISCIIGKIRVDNILGKLDIQLDKILREGRNGIVNNGRQQKNQNTRRNGNGRTAIKPEAPFCPVSGFETRYFSGFSARQKPTCWSTYQSYCSLYLFTFATPQH